MRKILELVCALLVAILFPTGTFAQVNNSSEAHEDGNSSRSRNGDLEISLQQNKNDISSLEKRLDDFQSDLEWYGLLIAVVGVGFGALVTVSPLAADEPKPEQNKR